MNTRFPRTVLVWLVVGWCGASGLFAQSLPRLENDYRNIFSLQPPSQWPPPPPSVEIDPRVPTPGQWRNGAVLGGWQTHRLPQTGPVKAGPGTDVAGPTTLIYPSFRPLDGTGAVIPGQGVLLASAVIARPVTARVPNLYFGEVIPRPSINHLGQVVTDPAATFVTEPANSSTGLFYYSPHVRKVFATQVGVIQVEWAYRVPVAGVSTFSVQYVVSASPEPGRDVRRMYWTEKGFKGPVVSIPAGPISAVNIRHSTDFPAQVGSEFVSPYETPAAAGASLPPEVRTLWWSSLDNSLHAYNKEGRVFVEFLGALDNQTGLRQFLGTEVVEVVREVSPTTVTMSVGDRILAHDGDTSLIPRPVTGVSTGFVHQHGVTSKNEVHYYAVRTTTPTVSGSPSGEVTLFWMRKGDLDLVWPRLYDSYVITWPDNQDAYTLYVRQNTTDGDDSATGLLLDTANRSALVFQNDPGGQHAFLENGNLFYTRVTAANPTGYALIRHQNGENIWFERVFSRLDSTFPGYGVLETVEVGQRIEAPAGFESALGYVRREKTANGFKPAPFALGLYKDPFVDGIAAAKTGAIIPVNARAGDNTLEVWWYKQTTPPAGSTIKANYVPVIVKRYSIQWPTNASKIIMAANAGTGDLPTAQAAGGIYVQNDDKVDGFNPNDEHALMLSGRAYALRDDLATAQTSPPFVLISYTHSDGRPAIRPFSVVREEFTDTSTTQFAYEAEAGRVLQAPMPLPLLPPVKIDGVVASREVMPKAEDTPPNADHPVTYRKYTFTDRKGTIWLYRGPHEGTGKGLLRMKYFYPFQEGFYVPNLATQPKAGDPMPYLRAYDPATQSYIGSTTGAEGQALDIFFEPKWPAFAPVLNFGETLTTPNRGLPAVRGQTSLEVLYDQSIANNSADITSVILHDPTVAKTFGLGGSGALAKIPDSVFTNNYRGKIYFPNLPPHLVERFYFDPNMGAKGTLVLLGQFKDEVLGDDYLLLNVLSTADIKALENLCHESDVDLPKWISAINGLKATLRPMVENNEKRGTFIAAQEAIPSKVTKIWNYISRVDSVTNKLLWEGSNKPPTASEVRAGAQLDNDDDVNTAIGWIAANLPQLKSWAEKRSLALAADKDIHVLRSSFHNHMFNRLDALGMASYDAFAPWIFSADRQWSSTNRNMTASQFYQATAGMAYNTTAWAWLRANLHQLADWDRGRIAGTELADIEAALKADYETTEEQATISIDVRSLVATPNQDIPVDSYALTAHGGGRGWVVLIAGNSRALTPADEPVSIYIMRVENPLGRGELKVINPTNPLAEKLTLQHSQDFAGEPADYEFEWRYSPPVNGQPPATYTFTSSVLFGATTESWTTRTQAQVDSGAAGGSISLPGQVGANQGAASIVQLEKTFTISALPFRAFLSLDLGPLDGARVSVNGSAIARKSVPGESDTATVAKPLPSFNPLAYLYEIPLSLLKSGSNQIIIEPFSSGDPGSQTLINARFETMNETDVTTAPLPGTGGVNWISVGPLNGETSGVLGSSVVGRNRYVIEGNSLFTLTDNFFICRYRARNPNHAGYDPAGGWSKWTNPQLAEGWIKRALAGINPFEQRVKDLYSNDVNTDVSLITQAGKRWEGDVALNLENINSFGLIEIYETILRRGKSLSIEGAPALNYGPANDALLLAAGYLNDLYMLLGNEAAADAANPTIAFSTNAGQFGDVATSLFSFKGQLASVLDEELALLRGRDDFLAPGTTLRPVFNRLIWNYTRGIDNGEAVYALNYNIKDLDASGSVSAADAAKAYPQGHGDGYGHYLTALKNYYTLLWNSNFAWQPRVETVSLLGQPVTVDYFDERKFAGAAAAWTKTAAQVVDLSYRASYNPAVETSKTWIHLRDGRANSQTGITRDWGVDDWAARGGQGSYFHWLTSNSMLPETSTQEGIQKIDRTTVPEIKVLVTQSEEIQRSLDRANAGLNPLGLSSGAVSFDISPTEVDQGKTHYEQVYQRAVTALTNAASSFNQAKSVTQLLRSQEDSLDERRAAIYAQERAYDAQLREIYGTPYPEDMGPGKTWPQGYTGPDLVNYMYVDMPELEKNASSSVNGSSSKTFYLVMNPNFTSALTNIQSWSKITRPDGTINSGVLGDVTPWVDFSGRVELYKYEADGDPPEAVTQLRKDLQGAVGDQLIEYTLDSSGQYQKPEAFTGRRAQPGQIQQAIGNLLTARLRLENSLEDHADFVRDLGRIARDYQAALVVHDKNRELLVWNFAQTSSIEGVIAVLEAINRDWEDTEETTQWTADASSEALPKVAGTANDATSSARAAIKLSSVTTKTVTFSASALIETTISALQQTLNNLQRAVELNQFDVAWYTEHMGLLNDLKAGFEELEDRRRTTDAALRTYQNAVTDLRAVIARGQQLQDDRAEYRLRAAAIIHGYRTKDFGFRAFRNEALESYKSLFDLASRYTYLAARAYDYETGLVNTSGSSTANAFYQSIVRSRAVGVFANGVPQIAGSTGGDPGLSGALARMQSDWSVVKSRYGFNNPDRYRTTFSLRREANRILPDASGLPHWKDMLSSSYRPDLQLDEDVKRHCLNINPAGSLTVPGFVIEFETSINTGFNFFGQALASGDSTFSPSSFATKIRSSGIAFPGYVGMASPTSVGGSLSGTGSSSPNDPGTGFTDPNGLSATPYIYLIPVGVDSIRAPVPADSNIVRSWQIEDQAIPLPFDIGGAFSATNLTGLQSLTETFTLRKHQAFRAVPNGTVFSSSPGFTNSRLIGRSVWNSKWKLVIPGHTLHSNPVNGLKTFQNTVTDILLYFESYSYSGN